MKRTLSVIAILAVLGLVLGGCASPEQRAQKLFDQGKYEEVLKKYPDQPVAKQAKDKVAEKMLAEGRYEEILANYADTPSATEATNKIAEKLVAQRKYDEVLTKYPNTWAANMAREGIADQLYENMKIDELVAMYPNTQAGMKARNEMAKAELNRIMKLGKKARVAALRAFLKNPRFQGTDSAIKLRMAVDRVKESSTGEEEARDVEEQGDLR